MGVWVWREEGEEEEEEEDEEEEEEEEENKKISWFSFLTSLPLINPHAHNL